MLLGPVFRAELVRTPRRGRYYSLRVIYGSVLILLLWANYQDLNGVADSRGGQPSIAEASNFASPAPGRIADPHSWNGLRAVRLCT